MTTTGTTTSLAERLFPDRDPFPADGEIGWGLAEAVLAFLAAQSFSIIGFGIASRLIYGDDGVPPLAERETWTIWALSAGLWLGYLIGPWFFTRVTGGGPMIEHSLRISPRQGLVAVVLGVVSQLAVLPVLYWPILRFVDEQPGDFAEELAARADGLVGGLFLFGAAAVIAPIVEEWFYRGMLLPALARRFGTIAGVLGSTVLFTLVHRPISYPGIFFFGLVLAGIRVATGRLAPAIVAHMAFNTVTVIALLFF
ncbi:MAG: CPBP family intramembrane glutamic endopeptidase [Actinomycetota bacterium]